MQRDSIEAFSVQLAGPGEETVALQDDPLGRQATGLHPPEATGLHPPEGRPVTRGWLPAKAQADGGPAPESLLQEDAQGLSSAVHYTALEEVQTAQLPGLVAVGGKEAQDSPWSSFSHHQQQLDSTPQVRPISAFQEDIRTSGHSMKTQPAYFQQVDDLSSHHNQGDNMTPTSTLRESDSNHMHARPTSPQQHTVSISPSMRPRSVRHQVPPDDRPSTPQHASSTHQNHQQGNNILLLPVAAHQQDLQQALVVSPSMRPTTANRPQSRATSGRLRGQQHDHVGLASLASDTHTSAHAKGILARRRQTIMGHQLPHQPQRTSLTSIGDTPPAARGVSFARPTAGRRRSQDLQPPLPLGDVDRDSLEAGLLPLPALGDGPASGGAAAMTGLEGTPRAASAREGGPSRQRSFILNAKVAHNKRQQSEGAQAHSSSPSPHSMGMTTTMPLWKQTFLRVMNNPWYYVLLVFVALYIIFEDDIKRAALPPSADLPLEIMITVILVFIAMEMVVSCFVKPGYFLGFYFWLDAVVVASLFFEVPSVRNQILGLGTEPLNLANQDNFIVWAGTRAFIGSKVARVVRVFRLLRLLRLYSLYKRFQARRRVRAALAKAGITPGGQHAVIEAEELSLIELEILQDTNRETRVGQKLEELIVRRIIVFVLVCVLLLPMFEANYGVWGKWQGVDQGGLAMLHNMALQVGGEAPPQPPGWPSFNTTFGMALQTYMDVVPFKMGLHSTAFILMLTIRNTTYIPPPVHIARRYDELYVMQYRSEGPLGQGCMSDSMMSLWNVSQTAGLGGLGSTLAPDSCPVWYTTAVFDWKWFSQVQAILNISRSLFVIGFLTLGAWLLSRDSRVLVLEPIERMVARVTALADNPLALQPVCKPPWQDQLDRRRQRADEAAAAAAGGASSYASHHHQLQPVHYVHDGSPHMNGMSPYASYIKQQNQAQVKADASWGLVDGHNGISNGAAQHPEAPATPDRATMLVVQHAASDAEAQRHTIIQVLGEDGNLKPATAAGAATLAPGVIQRASLPSGAHTPGTDSSGSAVVTALVQLGDHKDSNQEGGGEGQAGTVHVLKYNMQGGTQAGDMGPDHVLVLDRPTHQTLAAVPGGGKAVPTTTGSPGGAGGQVVVASSLEAWTHTKSSKQPTSNMAMQALVPAGNFHGAYHANGNVSLIGKHKSKQQHPQQSLVNGNLHVPSDPHGAKKPAGTALTHFRSAAKGVAATTRFHLAAFGVRWSVMRAAASRLLSRVATNFWDGTEEEGHHTSGPSLAAGGSSTGAPGGGGGGQDSYETQILENSIQKIGALLAVGFGDAGAEVIAENIRKEGDINPMVPGKKTVAIFGFCDIRRFTDATEVLQEEVMEFVNSIARIVHTSCALHGGAANKNIGDAFLLVWKFPKGFTARDLQEVTNSRSTVTTGAGAATTQGLSSISEAGDPVTRGNSSSTAVPAAGAVQVPEPGRSLGATEAVPGGGERSLRGSTAWPSLQARRIMAHMTSSLQGRDRALLSVPFAGSHTAAAGVAGLPGSPKPRLGSLPLASNQVMPLPLLARGSQALGMGGLNSAGPSHNVEDDLDNVALRKVMRLRSQGTHGASFLTLDDKREVVNAVADNALAAFIIIHAALRRSVRLARYAARADLAARLGPGFRVQMGFGLHVGWAIEGAIGSEYKIDASYLSPNVNMASRLEAATKQFGVSLLLSQDFVDCLSPGVRARVRQIDCVTVKGSVQPLGLFTYDIDLDSIPEPDPDMPGAEEEEEAFWADYVTGWADNADLAATWGVNDEFMAQFEAGFEAYKKGDWSAARAALESTLNSRCGPEGEPLVDGPSRVLLNFMGQHGFTAPPDWRGYRELTEK